MTQTSSFVQTYRMQRTSAALPFLQAWYARWGATAMRVEDVARAIEDEPTGELARLAPLHDKPYTTRALRVALGTALRTLAANYPPDAPITLARAGYDGHNRAWYWSVRPVER